MLIVGLGNPLPKYKNTRHNIGQAIVSYFQKINNFPDFNFKKKIESLISEGKINGKKIILALPQTFMNESGRAVQKLIRNYKLPITNLLIIHDDIDLPLGKIRIRKKSSSGGHKGVQSIIDYLKTEDFVRVKVGVANEKRKKIPAEKFVLEKFEENEKEILKKIIKKTCKIIKQIVENEKKENQSISV